MNAGQGRGREAVSVSPVKVHAQVHDSVVVSVPKGRRDLVCEVARRMLAAAADRLPGVLVKVELCGPGRSWYEAKEAGEECISTADLERDDAA